MKVLTFAAVLTLLPLVMATPLPPTPRSFVMTATNVSPADGEAANATAVQQLNNQPVQAYDSHFWIGHAPGGDGNSIFQLLTSLGFPTATGYNFWGTDNKKSPSLTLDVIQSSLYNYQPVLVAPQGELYFTGVVTSSPKDANPNTAFISAPFNLTADNPPRLLSPNGPAFYACWASGSDDIPAYQIFALRPDNKTTFPTCSKIELAMCQQTNWLGAPNYFVQAAAGTNGS